MWTQIYDEFGQKINASQNFLSLLSSSEGATITSKVELLDTDLRKVKDSTIYSADRTNLLTNFITDGNIDVDTSRGARRTAELTLMNPTAEFTPGTDRFENGAGEFTGKVYLNRIVRLWKGLYVSNQPMYVPVGTFMIDGAAVMMERNMSLVNLTMTDLWKKLSKSYFGGDRTYPADTHYNTIINQLLDEGGVDLDSAVLTGMPERDNDERRLASKLTCKEGESRGDKLKDLGRRWDLDMYFDPLGSFRSEDRLSDRDRAIVWRFTTPPVRVAEGSHLITLTRSFNDDNLYNRVVVLYTGNDKKNHRVTRANNNPSSPLNRDRIGDRALVKTYDDIKTEKQANRALDRLWRLRTQMSETIDAQVMANPCLEGDDVVTFKETNFVKVNAAYRLSRFTVPLVSSLQTVQAMKTLDEDNF